MNRRVKKTKAMDEDDISDGSELEDFEEGDEVEPLPKAKAKPQRRKAAAGGGQSSQRRTKKAKSDTFFMESDSDLDGHESFDDDVIDITPHEAGQITMIYVENFMCHQKMTVKFGKHVNFVTGQNGSGESIQCNPFPPY